MLLHQICVLLVCLLRAIDSYMNVFQFGKLPHHYTQANLHSYPQVLFRQQKLYIGTSPLGPLHSDRDVAKKMISELFFYGSQVGCFTHLHL